MSLLELNLVEHFKNSVSKYKKLKNWLQNMDIQIQRLKMRFRSKKNENYFGKSIDFNYIYCMKKREYSIEKKSYNIINENVKETKTYKNKKDNE